MPLLESSSTRCSIFALFILCLVAASKTSSLVFEPAACTTGSMSFFSLTTSSTLSAGLAGFVKKERNVSNTSASILAALVLFVTLLNGIPGQALALL